MKPCIVCGEVTGASRCPDHAAKAAREARGYDRAWQRLSRKARKLQPFCEDCGTTEDLTTDHLPSAWERKAKGLRIRLVDVAVVCRPCNSKRGAARPGAERRSAVLAAPGVGKGSGEGCGGLQHRSEGRQVGEVGEVTPLPASPPSPPQPEFRSQIGEMP